MASPPEPPEIVEVEETVVACDGGAATGRGGMRGGAALGHPRVYLHLGADDAVDCPYCDRRFVRRRRPPPRPGPGAVA